jgi:rhodanese-related sulfurtransferase
MAIIAISSLVALSVNSFRHPKLPIVTDWSEMTQPSASSDGEQDLTISFEDAEALYFDHKAVFLDARPNEQFRLGHIEGARNLPWEEFDRLFPQVMSDIPRDSTIVAYCEGDRCSLSRELALTLSAEGYAHARVLPDGWGLWKQHGLPADRQSPAPSDGES